MKVSSKGCTYLYEYNDVRAVPSGRQIDVDKSTLSKITTEVIKQRRRCYSYDTNARIETAGGNM